ncbi:hypothetical protein GEMRC1_011459 [Eukaryota sp. GEM-RC1]
MSHFLSFSVLILCFDINKSIIGRGHNLVSCDVRLKSQLFFIAQLLVKELVPLNTLRIHMTSKRSKYTHEEDCLLLRYLYQDLKGAGGFDYDLQLGGNAYWKDLTKSLHGQGMLITHSWQSIRQVSPNTSPTSAPQSLQKKKKEPLKLPSSRSTPVSTSTTPTSTTIDTSDLTTSQQLECDIISNLTGAFQPRNASSDQLSDQSSSSPSSSPTPPSFALPPFPDTCSSPLTPDASPPGASTLNEHPNVFSSSSPEKNVVIVRQKNRTFRISYIEYFQSIQHLAI